MVHPFAFKIKRKFPRYNILHLPELRGSIGSLKKSFRVVALGEGGAGFIASGAGRTLHPPLKLECFFEMAGVCPLISIRSDLLYAFVSDRAGDEHVFYGVEFDEAGRDLIRPIVSALSDISRASPNKVELDVLPES